jgi:DUF1680 family protein
MKEHSSFLIQLGLILITGGIILSGCYYEKNNSQDYPICPVPFTDVKINDNFWAKRLEINHKVTIPIAFKMAEETGRIDNFRIAGKLKEGKFSSLYPFDDSDVYKNIEAACYSIQLYPDPQFEAYLDTLIAYIAAAQEDDGYLYTNRTIDPENTHEMAGKERWINEEQSSHELYNAGHLYEAAVAHYQATGKRSLLDVAIKNANLVDSLFGWGKIEKAPGHQEIEIGLVKLFRATGELRYLDLAKFFLDVRGPGKEEYNQMHRKIIDQDSATGHAVRAQYMYAAMADVAALTGEKEYLFAIDRIWDDVVDSKTYITGGTGSVRDIEGFGNPYELPNLEAYCETCAAIANAFWNYRMFLLHGESKYLDVFEKVLYNGLLSGVSLSGDHFFYPNPLASDCNYARKPWFGCACCPVNITRFLPSLPGYIYALDDQNLYINLFISNEAYFRINNQSVHLSQLTEYPWEGDVAIKFGCNSPIPLNLMVRIPGWARNEAFPSDLYYFMDDSDKQPEFYLNGNKVKIVEKNGYASIERIWTNGDKLLIRFPMEIRKVKANKRVRADSNRLTVQRGPVVFCIESIDQELPDIKDLIIEGGSEMSFQFDPVLLKGVGVITGKIKDCKDVERGKSELFEGKFKAIPYYSWANRGPGKMAVWINGSCP